MKFLAKITQTYKEYERVLIPGMLIVGVIADFITFRTINTESAFIILGLYWFIAGLTILFLIWQRRKLNANTLTSYYSVVAPLVLQFTFGATLSASFIFYWFSGALSISWPFMLFIAFLMIANEAFREYYMKPVVQLSVYYFITFSLASLMLPYLFKTISFWTFLLSGILSLAIAAGYIRFLQRLFSFPTYKVRRTFMSIFIIFAFMNGLYFTNLIPPIPLSLTEAGIYHDIQRVNNSYVMQQERQNILQKLYPGETAHIQQGEPLFVYTSIFAPFDIETTIVHKWEYFDADTKKWEVRDQLAFEIYGGREDGFRGYSQKSALDPGFWRVSIQTPRGQTVGRVRFRLHVVEKDVPTVEIQR